MGGGAGKVTDFEVTTKKYGNHNTQTIMAISAPTMSDGVMNV